MITLHFSGAISFKTGYKWSAIQTILYNSCLISNLKAYDYSYEDGFGSRYILVKSKTDANDFFRVCIDENNLVKVEVDGSHIDIYVKEGDLTKLSFDVVKSYDVENNLPDE